MKSGTIAILILVVSMVMAFADPNSVMVTTYKKINDNTVTKTEVTTFIKSTLESERVALIAQRDRQVAQINARYQPLIDDIDMKLNLFK